MAFLVQEDSEWPTQEEQTTSVTTTTRWRRSNKMWQPIEIRRILISRFSFPENSSSKTSSHETDRREVLRRWQQCERSESDISILVHPNLDRSRSWRDQRMGKRVQRMPQTKSKSCEANYGFAYRFHHLPKQLWTLEDLFSQSREECLGGKNGT